MELPQLPEKQQLADWCRETASAERVQPWTVEKDFVLTRLIWALAQVHGEHLLLKGGTCLSKVDLGYHRMSEDIDVTIPGEPTRYQSINSRQINPVVRTLRDFGPVIGASLVNFEGERSEKDAHALWEVRYESSFLPPASAAVEVEVSIRPAFLAPRNPALRQLMPSSLLGGYDDARCWALDFAEVRAEKVRAAFTRDKPEIRDFYDLGLLADARADMESEPFRKLVDAKLGEVGADPLDEQPQSFGLTPERRRAMLAGIRSLESVIRINEPAFDLDLVLDYYNKLWNKVPTN